MIDRGGRETPISRRRFVQGAMCAAAGTALTSLSGTIVAGQTPVGKEAMHEFPYGAVRLTGGPLMRHFDRIHAHYLALDNDRLLKVFRQRAGLPAPGPDMGGWYDTDGFVPGLTLGQYISGLARLGAATNDQAAHEKVARLVSGFGEFIRRADSPYAGPNAQTQWAAYVMDKYVVGLIDAFRLSGVEEAKRLLPFTIDKCLPHVSPVSRDRIGKTNPPYDETYVISENLFHVADITGDDKYRNLAVHYLLDREWFDPLAAGIDVLPEKHAYGHIVALSSGAQAYLNSGDTKYLNALTNAWRFLERQRFASGGWAPDEQFVHLGQGKLADSLTTSKAHFETPCGSYADLKLARYLIRLTGRPEYGDGLERTLYNTVLATRLPDSDGDYPYYSDYGAGAEKRYYPRKWPCCSGTLVQAVADYVLNVYFHDDDTLLVNLYVASEVVWKRAGSAVAIVQDTGYPATDTVRLTVREPGNGRFAIKLRIPVWAKGATLRVNGRSEGVIPGDFATLRRGWKAGDTIDMVVPQPLRTLSIDSENPKLRALMRGAVMYVGLNPWDGIGTQAIDLPASLSPISGSEPAFRTVLAGRDLMFVPYFTVDTERYNTYFRVV